MRIYSFILIYLTLCSCAMRSPNEKGVIDSIAKVDSLTRDSITTADSIQMEYTRMMMADLWKQGDPEAQAAAFKMEIINDTVVIHKVEYDAMSFAFPGGQEYSGEDKLTGFGDDTWTDGGLYTFEITHSECVTEEMNAKIDGLDSTYTKQIGGQQFTIATGGVGGRDETNYYICYLTNYNNCISFSMEVRESGGGMNDYPALVTQFEDFIASVKFKKF